MQNMEQSTELQSEEFKSTELKSTEAKSTVLQPNETRAKQNQLSSEASSRKKDLNYFPHKPVGKTGAILNTVFGSILAGGFGIPVMITTIAGVNPGVILGLSIPFAAGILMGVSAARLFKRINRYKRYLSLFKGSDFCFVEELADYSGFSKRFVVRDLRRMLQKGFFPHAHITQDNSLILLTKGSYERYIFEQRRRKMIGEAVELKNDPAQITENNATVVEGRALLNQVSMANMAIYDRDVKGKVLRLEDVIRQIINHIEKHPEQVGNVRRFIALYLPTVIKLLNVYKELESHSIEGQNITTTKEDIVNSLDMINGAFENLFNNLFAGISIDISSDITVLNNLLAADGLMKDDMF